MLGRGACLLIYSANIYETPVMGLLLSAGDIMGNMTDMEGGVGSGEKQGLWSRQLGFKPWLHHLVAVHPWAGY